MKLFVDDQRACPEGWHLARTITDAIRILAKQCIKEISLDHDIASFRYRDKNLFETFEPVAHYIALMSEWDRPAIRIHTANIQGGQRMAEILGVAYDNRIYDPADYK